MNPSFPSLFPVDDGDDAFVEPTAEEEQLAIQQHQQHRQFLYQMWFSQQELRRMLGLPELTPPEDDT